MSAQWQLRLKSAAGALVALLDSYTGLAIERNVNTAGAFAVRLGKGAAETEAAFTTRVGLFALDGQIEFWRRDIANGIAWYNEFEGLIRRREYYVTEDGGLLFEASGRGYIDLLDRRVIAAAAGSAGGTKSGACETVMKAFVEEQCAATAGARAIAGLTVQADGAHGNTINRPAAYKNVLEVLKGLARIGGGDYDVVGTVAATYEFRWYTGQRGTDRSATLTFGLPFGNMANPRLVIARQDERNAVLVGGQGEGAARTTVWRTDAAAIAESPINRRELFLDQRDATTAGALNSSGDIALEELRPVTTLDFDVLQTAGSLYGLHYTLGDIVNAKFLGYETHKKVVTVNITVEESGEDIKPRLEDV